MGCAASQARAGVHGVRPPTSLGSSPLGPTVATGVPAVDARAAPVANTKGEVAHIVADPDSEALIRQTAENWFFKGNALAFKGEYRGAVNAFDSALTLLPKFPKAQYQRGLAHLELGRENVDKAMDDFEAGVAMGYSLAHLGCARVLLQRDQVERALSSLHLAHQLRPKDSAVYRLRAEAYRALGSAEAAEKEALIAEVMEQTKECVVCMDSLRSTRLVQCKHSSMCGQCAEDIRRRGSRCPICSEKFDTIEYGNFLNDTFDPGNSLGTCTDMNTIQNAAKIAGKFTDEQLQSLDDVTRRAIFPEGILEDEQGEVDAMRAYSNEQATAAESSVPITPAAPALHSWQDRSTLEADQRDSWVDEDDLYATPSEPGHTPQPLDVSTVAEDVHPRSLGNDFGSAASGNAVDSALDEVVDDIAQDPSGLN